MPAPPTGGLPSTMSMNAPIVPTACTIAKSDGLRPTLEDILRLLVEQQSTLQVLLDQRDALHKHVEQQFDRLKEDLKQSVSQCNFSLQPASVMLPQRQQTGGPVDSVHTHKSIGASLGLVRSQNDLVAEDKPVAIAGSEFKDGAGTDTVSCREPRRSPLAAQIHSILTSHQIDVAMSVIILLHICLMVVQIQWRGFNLAFQLNLRPDNNNWQASKKYFFFVDVVFNLIYVLELLLRIWAQGWAFYKIIFNQLDALIVIVSGAEILLLRPLSYRARGVNFSYMRLTRLLRIFHSLSAVKVLRLIEFSQEMRILVRTLVVSLHTIFWSMILIACIIGASSIFMATVSAALIINKDIDLDLREWMYEEFGNFSRCAYTMFEATFSARWTAHAGRLIKEVDPLFALFWIPYVVLVNFTVIRIVSAMFLKQTMAEAAIDAERTAMDKIKRKEKVAKEVRFIFEAADKDGNGVISREEFDKMITNAEIAKALRNLDLEMEEAIILFAVLSEDDGSAHYDEFLQGAMILKGSARTIDTVHIMQRQLTADKHMREVLASLTSLETALGVRHQTPKMPHQSIC